MEGRRFDDLTRRMVQRSNRRQTIKQLGVGVVAAAATLLGRQSTEAAICREDGSVCREDANCCSGICGDKNTYGRRTCHCGEPGDDRGEYCNGKCCGTTGRCVRNQCYYPSTQSTSYATDAAWAAILQGEAFAPVLSMIDLKPEIGHRFQIQPGRRARNHALIEAEVLELALPDRARFRWRAAEMSDWATAELTLTDAEDGMMIGINRVEGDPATCDLATQLLGKAWQHRAFNLQLPRTLGLQTPE